MNNFAPLFKIWYNIQTFSFLRNRMPIHDNRGFTLVEIIITITVLAIIFALSAPVFRNLQANLDSVGEIREIIGSIRYAQSRTLASEGASQYGIYFSTSAPPQSYTLFKGESYVSRMSQYDIVRQLKKTIISAADLSGGSEVVFDRITGLTSQQGHISFYSADNPAETADLYISSSGQVSSSPFSTSTLASGRLSDSRHVHFTYSRTIDIASSTSENIYLKIGTTTQDINISSFLSGSNLYYNNPISVNGNIEQVVLQTLRLNDPDTLFCVFRDGKQNDLQLDIDLSGDFGVTPNLISFGANGLTTSTGTSIFVGGPQWQ